MTETGLIFFWATVVQVWFWRWKSFSWFLFEPWVTVFRRERVFRTNMASSSTLLNVSFTWFSSSFLSDTEFTISSIVLNVTRKYSYWIVAISFSLNWKWMLVSALLKIRLAPPFPCFCVAQRWGQRSVEDVRGEAESNYSACEITEFSKFHVHFLSFTHLSPKVTCK